MSINISAVQQRHPKSINITYDLETFGPRQRIAMLRSMRTGLFTGISVCNDIAKSVRYRHGLGNIHFRSGGITWEGLKPTQFGPLIAAVTTAKLKGTHSSDDKYAASGLKLINESAPSGWLHILGARAPSLSIGACPELEVFAADIEAGKVTELTVPL